MEKYIVVRTFMGEDGRDKLQQAFDAGYVLVRASEFVPDVTRGNSTYLGYIEYILAKENSEETYEAGYKKGFSEGCEHGKEVGAAKGYFDGQAYGWETGREELITEISAEIGEAYKEAEKEHCGLEYLDALGYTRELVERYKKKVEETEVEGNEVDG